MRHLHGEEKARGQAVENDDCVAVGCGEKKGCHVIRPPKSPGCGEEGAAGEGVRARSARIREEPHG